MQIVKIKVQVLGWLMGNKELMTMAIPPCYCYPIPAISIHNTHCDSTTKAPFGRNVPNTLLTRNGVNLILASKPANYRPWVQAVIGQNLYITE